MYSISEAYRTKMFDNVQTHSLRGTINQNFIFTDDDVIGVSYTNQCSDKKVALGSVNIGVLKMTFLKDILNRGDYYDKKIVISDRLLTGYDGNDDPVWESVPIGEFYVDYTFTPGQATHISAWNAGSATTFNHNGYMLTIVPGTAPTMTKADVNVITGVT